MDTVELPRPPAAAAMAAAAAVSVSKLIGPEGFGRVGVGVTVNGVEARESENVFSVVSPEIDKGSSLISQKDGIDAVGASESVSWSKMPDSELYRHASKLSSFQGADMSEELLCDGTNSPFLLIPRPEAKQLQQKAGKVSRSSSNCSKRLRAAQMEDSVSQDGGRIFDNLGPCPSKCTFPEKVQVIKQKSNPNGKRGDKRNCKIPLKTKYDSLSLKAGLVGFSSAAGGSGIFGMHGLKLDIHDFTKLENELSLNDLLVGSYECPRFGKDKGKKGGNSNENILQSVRKACSILHLRSSVRLQNFAEVDNSFNRKMSTCSLSCGSRIAASLDIDKGDRYCTDLCSCNKIDDSCSMPETSANMPDFPSYQPIDVLRHLAFPPAEDLESLLWDPAKPAVSSRNTSDLCSGKSISHRACFPPFPWSHAFGGHSKTNSDAVKSASRNTCQGRWFRIEAASTPIGGVLDCFEDLELLTYDHSLVPSGGQKSGSRADENNPTTSVSHPWCQQGVSFSATCSQVPPDFGCSTRHQESGELSPRALAAAQTLSDIGTYSFKQKPQGMIWWPKKSSQKAVKANRTKSSDRFEEILAMPEFIVEPNGLVENANQILPPKRPKFSMNEKKKDTGLVNTTTKGPINWSTPRSSRSSPGKSFKESTSETKHFHANIKQSLMISPTTRVLDKACNSQRKLRKLVPMNWSRAKGKTD